MKLYSEPEMQVIKYSLTDVLSPSSPEVSVPDVSTGDNLDDDWD